MAWLIDSMEALTSAFQVSISRTSGRSSSNRSAFPGALNPSFEHGSIERLDPQTALHVDERARGAHSRGEGHTRGVVEGDGVGESNTSGRSGAIYNSSQ